MHTTVDGVSTTELHTLKWLKWQIFCHIYFATIKKKKKRPLQGPPAASLFQPGWVSALQMWNRGWRELPSQGRAEREEQSHRCRLVPDADSNSPTKASCLLRWKQMSESLSSQPLQGEHRPTPHPAVSHLPVHNPSLEVGHLMRRADSLEKNPDSGKDWRQKQKGAAEYKRVRQHH